MHCNNVFLEYCCNTGQTLFGPGQRNERGTSCKCGEDKTF